MREPNFFIVGAPKAGTTSLYHYLNQHPDIYMSPMKEPCYFSSEVRPEFFEPRRRQQAYRLVEDVLEYLHGPMNEERFGGIVCRWEDYLRLFAAATTERAVGEASVNYLWSATAAEGIASRIPQAKIVMVLRSPAERAFSQYLHNLSDGLITDSFAEYVRASLRRGSEGLGVYKPFLEMGFYADQVQRYMDYFPREQIGIWIYEETKSRPHEFMRELLEFLEVDSSFSPDISKRYLEPQIARMVRPKQGLRRTGMWEVCKRLTPSPIKSLVRNAVYRPSGSVTMTAQDRGLMLDFYKKDIRRLEEILGRELTHWVS